MATPFTQPAPPHGMERMRNSSKNSGCLVFLESDIKKGLFQNSDR